MKKFIALLLTVVLTATAAIGGTLAYLQDTDEAKNTMTTKEVTIEQKEWQRAENVGHTNTQGTGAAEGDLVVFDQDEPIYPAVASDNSAYQPEMSDLFYWGTYAPGGNGLWDDAELANVRDKIVMVTNTGDTAAYFRTIVAFECPEDFNGDLIHINANTGWYTNRTVGFADINGVRYFLVEYTYKGDTGSGAGVLAANETARPSLLQVCIDGAATNEDMAKLGDTWEVLVVSQAVQSAMGTLTPAQALDEAFGEVTADSVQTIFANVAPGDETPPADPNATGTITLGYTNEDRIWGECTGSAKNSLVVKAYSGDTYMGSSSLNNINGIIDGDVTVTWNLYLDPASHTDGYWTTNWAIAPTINQQPTKVELWVDGTKVAENVVQLNGPDNLNKIGGAVTDSTGKILKYVVGNVQPELGTGEQYHSFS